MSLDFARLRRGRACFHTAVEFREQLGGIVKVSPGYEDCPGLRTVAKTIQFVAAVDRGDSAPLEERESNRSFRRRGLEVQRDKLVRIWFELIVFSTRGGVKRMRPFYTASCL